MKLIAIVFSLLFFPCILLAAEGNFSWLPNDDGGLTEGYAIHYGESTGEYTIRVAVGFPTPVDGRVYGSIPNIPEGIPLFFAATAHYNDESNNRLIESDFSTEIEHTFSVTEPLKPQTPGDVRVEEI